MSTDLTTDYPQLEGLLVPDSRIVPDNLWTAESSYEQGGPRVGMAVPQSDTGGVVETLGTQSADGAIRLQFIAPGLPGSAGYAFKPDSGDDDYAGWDPPVALRDVRTWRWTDTTTTADDCKHPHAVALEDGTVIGAYYSEGGTPTQYAIDVTVRDALGSVTTVAEVYVAAAAPYDEIHPCLLRISDTEVLLYHWVEDSDLSQAQIRVHLSTDGGSTWSVTSSSALTSALDISNLGSAGSAQPGAQPLRIRAAYDPVSQDVMLVAHVLQNDTDLTARDVLLQFYSSDRGRTFKLISTWDGDNDYGGIHDLMWTPAGFALVYSALSTATVSKTYFRAVGAAYSSFALAPQTELFDAIGGTGSVSSKVLADNDNALAYDPTGVLWWFIRDAGTGTQRIYAAYSLDGGRSWTEALGDAATSSGALVYVLTTNDTAAYPHQICAVWSKAQCLLVGNIATDTSNYADSILEFPLGGFATVTLPEHPTARTLQHSVGWRLSWLPLDRPGDIGWNAVGAGTDALDASAAQLNITTTGVQTRYFTRTGSPLDGNLLAGMIAECGVVVTTGGSLTANNIVFRADIDDGSEDYSVAVRLRANDIRVVDVNNAGATIASYTHNHSDGYRVLMAIAKGSDGAGHVRVWVSELTPSSNDHVRVYELAASSDALTDGGGGAGSNALVWGHQTGSASTSEWLYVGVQTGRGVKATGLQIAEGQTNPDDLRPRILTGLPGYLSDGVRVRGRGGVFAEGGVFHIDTRYDYPIEMLHPLNYPSPADQWRTEGEAATVQTIAWRMPTSGEELWGGGLIAIWVRTNVRTFAVDLYYSSSWTEAISVDMAQGMTSLQWAREGSTVQVDPSASSLTGTRVVFENELVGAQFEFDAGVGGVKRRTIIGNTAGIFTDAAEVTPILYLDPDQIDGTEGSTGTQGAVIMPEGVIFIQKSGFSDTIEGIRLDVEAQSSSTTDLRMKALIGRVYAFGQQTSRGTAVELEDGTQIVSVGAGRTTSIEAAPPLRRASFAWEDPIDTTAAFASTPSPNYRRTTSDTSGDPASIISATPHDITHLVEGIAGAKQPLVFLRHIPLGASGSTTALTTQRCRFLYGRLTGGIRRDNVLGSAARDEVVRIASVTIEGER